MKRRGEVMEEEGGRGGDEGKEGTGGWRREGG